MYKKGTILISLVLLVVIIGLGLYLVVGFEADAQTLNLTRGLQYGSQGEDVRALQVELSKYPSIYPEGITSGFFGRLTEQAVQRFQELRGIVSGGTPATTGFGRVGPSTRSNLIQFLSGGTGSGTSPVTQPVQPTETRELPWVPGKDSSAISLNKHLLEIDESILDLDLEEGGDMTIEIWFKTPVLTFSKMTLLSKGSNYGVGIQGFGSIFSRHSDTDVRDLAPYVQRNTWHHLKVVYSDETDEFYMDDIRVFVKAENKFIETPNDEPLIIGGAYDRNGKQIESFNGVIDEVKISKGSTVVLHIDFNEGKGRTLVNEANGNDIKGKALIRNSNDSIVFSTPNFVETVVTTTTDSSGTSSTGADSSSLIEPGEGYARFYQDSRVTGLGTEVVDGKTKFVISIATGETFTFDQLPEFEILEVSEATGGASSGTSVTPTSPPLLAFTASKSSIDWNGETTLVWRADYADSCSASGDWSGTKATSGQVTVSSLTENSQYALSCLGPGGSVGGVVSISVAPEPPVLPSGKQEYSVSGDKNARPRFIDVAIDPLLVAVGDTQTLTVKAFSEAAITSVVATTQLDTQSFTLPLVQKSSDSSGTIFEASWVVSDSNTKEYITTFTATDANGDVNTVNMSWIDPCTGIEDSQDSSLGVDCGVSTTHGIDGGNLTIQAGKTLTINDGGKFVWNPGKSITINGSIAISKSGSGGSLAKGYLFLPDSDGDGRPSSLNRTFSSNSSVSGYVRASTYKTNSTSDPDTYTIDANDNSAGCWRNRYADGDGDGYGYGALVCVGDDAGYVDNNTDCNYTVSTKWQNLSCYTDADADGYTTSDTPATLCTGATCSSPTATYISGSSGVDCDDTTYSETNSCYSYGQGYYYAQGYYYGYAQSYYYGYAQGYYYGYAQSYYYGYAQGYYYGYAQGYYYGYGQGYYYAQGYYYSQGYYYGQGYYSTINLNVRWWNGQTSSATCIKGGGPLGGDCLNGPGGCYGEPDCGWCYVPNDSYKAIYDDSCDGGGNYAGGPFVTSGVSEAWQCGYYTSCWK